MTLVAPPAPAARARARARRRASRPHRARDRGWRPRRTIRSRRAPPDPVDVWRPRPGQRGVPRRPSPARPRRLRGRRAICVAHPRQERMGHGRRHPHARARDGRGEHDLHQHLRHPVARLSVRAPGPHRDHEDGRCARPGGRPLVCRLPGLAPRRAGIRRPVGRLCDRHHQPGARRCRARAVRRAVCVGRHVLRAPRQARARSRLLGGRRSSWRRSRGDHFEQHLEEPLRGKPRRAGTQGHGERRHARDDHRRHARRHPLHRLHRCLDAAGADAGTGRATSRYTPADDDRPPARRCGPRPRASRAHADRGEPRRGASRHEQGRPA